MAIIECVPNFSEGNNPEIVAKITAAICSSEGVQLLYVDSGISANRTVVTFVGAPEAVLEGAFRGIREAAILIDMNKHKGTHPRIGATDVCPLVPVSGISMREVVQYARQLGKRVGEELHIPIYLYEHAATTPGRVNLAHIRKGGFEGLVSKLRQAEWTPDFGIPPFVQNAGATIIGARNFLLAYNVNLNTNNVKLAKEIAVELRSADDPTALPYLKAIGWHLKEHDIAQVSMNLTNVEVTSMHAAFEAVKEAAEKRGLEVTGSELVGLIPLQCLIQTGRYFMKQKYSEKTDEEDAILIEEAIQSLGLNVLEPFDPKERILEYNMKKNGVVL